MHILLVTTCREILKCVGSDVDTVSTELKLSTIQKIQFKSIVNKALSIKHSQSTSSMHRQPNADKQNGKDMHPLSMLNNNSNSSSNSSTKKRLSFSKKTANVDTEAAATIAKVGDKMKEIEKSLKMLQQQSKNIDAELSKTTKQIESAFGGIINEVNKRKASLLKTLTKIGQTEKKKLDSRSQALQQQHSSATKVKQQWQCFAAMDKESTSNSSSNAEQRRKKLLEAAASICKTESTIPYNKHHRFIDCKMDTGKLSKLLQRFGSVAVFNEIVPLLVALKAHRRSNKVDICWTLRSLNSNKKVTINQSNTLITPKSFNTESIAEDSGSTDGLLNNSSTVSRGSSTSLSSSESEQSPTQLEQKLRIECAYLPFETQLDAQGNNEVDVEFTDNVEITLCEQQISALNEYETATITIEIPNEKQTFLLRLSYFNGNSWSNYSNQKWIHFTPRLDLQHLDLRFDAERRGDNLQFNIEKHVVKCVTHDSLYHTCLFGMAVSRKICSVFKIKYKILAHGKYASHADFFIGFVTQSVADYNQALGCGNNKSCSVGVRVRGNELFLYDDQNSKTKLKYTPGRDMYAVGDTFKFIFDFTRNLYIFCHDIKQIFKRKLSAESIMPAITLGNQDEKIQVAAWEFQ